MALSIGGLRVGHAVHRPVEGAQIGQAQGHFVMHWAESLFLNRQRPQKERFRSRIVTPVLIDTGQIVERLAVPNMVLSQASRDLQRSQVVFLRARCVADRRNRLPVTICSSQGSASASARVATASSRPSR